MAFTFHCCFWQGLRLLALVSPMELWQLGLSQHTQSKSCPGPDGNLPMIIRLREECAWPPGGSFQLKSHSLLEWGALHPGGGDSRPV